MRFLQQQRASECQAGVSLNGARSAEGFWRLHRISNAQDGLLIKQLQLCSYLIPTAQPAGLSARPARLPGINMHLLSGLGLSVIYPDYFWTLTLESDSSVRLKSNSLPPFQHARRSAFQCSSNSVPLMTIRRMIKASRANQRVKQGPNNTIWRFQYQVRAATEWHDSRIGWQKLLRIIHFKHHNTPTHSVSFAAKIFCRVYNI